VSGVVLLLCAAVAMPFLISSNSSDQGAAAGTTTQAGDNPTGTGGDPASGLPVIGISGIPQTPSPTVPTSTAPGSSPPTTSSAPFQTITLDAVNYGTPYHSKSYCNNAMGVRLDANGASSVNFGNFTAPSQATYTITVYAGAPQSESGGGVPVALAIDGNDKQFSVSGCGATPVSLPQLPAGTHSVVVTFQGNQDQSVLIEKIVIGSP
jgi:hypothetical protein